MEYKNVPAAIVGTVCIGFGAIGKKRIQRYNFSTIFTPNVF